MFASSVFHKNIQCAKYRNKNSYQQINQINLAFVQKIRTIAKKKLKTKYNLSSSSNDIFIKLYQYHFLFLIV